MSTYVMSDIHGNSAAFFSMLRKINFSENDTLYILGDVIDRNPGSVDLLKYIKDKKNIVMLLGNHEYMMCEYYCGVDYWGNWEYNGGDETMALLDALGNDDKEATIEWVSNLPTKLSVHINGTEYILCHANPFGSEKQNIVWDRIKPDDSISNESGKIYIIGHTPTLTFKNGTNGAKMMKNNIGNLYYIDCGAAYTDFFGAKLCCLCIEDEKEYYVAAS